MLQVPLGEPIADILSDPDKSAVIHSSYRTLVSKGQSGSYFDQVKDWIGENIVSLITLH